MCIVFDRNIDNADAHYTYSVVRLHIVCIARLCHLTVTMIHNTIIHRDRYISVNRYI